MSKQDVQARISRILAENFSIGADRVTPDASFRSSLGLDSLDVVDFVFFIQQEFGFKAELSDFRGLHTVEDLASFITARADAA